MSETSKQMGAEGEDFAVGYLVESGFEIIARNFHSSQGEIDIIARDDDFLVFVEVKNYSYKSYGSPVGAIRKAKKQSLIHAAQTYLYKNRIMNQNCRFDVITIYRGYNGSQKLEHYRNAFGVK
jgi:putative endonuclease